MAEKGGTEENESTEYKISYRNLPRAIFCFIAGCILLGIVLGLLIFRLIMIPFNFNNPFAPSNIAFILYLVLFLIIGPIVLYFLIMRPFYQRTVILNDSDIIFTIGGNFQFKEKWDHLEQVLTDLENDKPTLKFTKKEKYSLITIHGPEIDRNLRLTTDDFSKQILIEIATKIEKICNSKGMKFINKSKLGSGNDG